MMYRSGFSLVEVAFSLMIITVGVTASMMVFPIALKSQQETRYRILAAAQVQALVHKLTANPELYALSEGEQVHDRPYTNAAVWSPDLENHLSTSAMSGGFLPLPRDIALRLDSDGDEIAEIVGQGGNLYFPSPGRATWMNPNIEQIGTEQFKIVLGIRGAPQQNMLNFHPQVKWPYGDFMPSPYAAAMKPHLALVERAKSVLPELAANATFVGDATGNALLGLSNALKALTPATDMDLIVAAGGSPMQIRGNRIDLDAEYGTGTGSNDPQSLRFNLRTALLCWYAYAAGEAAKAIAAPLNESESWPAGNPDVARFQIAYEMLLTRTRYLQVFHPYDLRLPRDRATMLFTDTPLLQFDLTRPPLQTTPMHAWNILAGQPITAIGSFTHYRATSPASDPIATGDRTSSTGWNLTNTFDASERIREVAVWAVDWMSYEDFEDVPSAPVAGALLGVLPRRNRGSIYWHSSNQRDSVTVGWAYQNGSPEYPYTWIDDVRRQQVITVDGEWRRNFCGGSNGSVPNRAMAWLGGFGADRNGNGRRDRGTAKASTRLRAVIVGRYLVYDPRGWVQVR